MAKEGAAGEPIARATDDEVSNAGDAEFEDVELDDDEGEAAETEELE